MKQLVLILTGIIVCFLVVIIITAGGALVDAEDPVYQNGHLVAAFQYNGEPKDVWVQCVIFRVDDLLSSEQIGDVLSLAETFSKGREVCEFPIDLAPGSYSVRLYVRERDEGSARLAAFIKNFEVV
ncbi:hypothetical protein McpSp1_12990 [Methanocorpusculaceae archaeon Sp1]|uniref:Uncharacterized protein n=1 Tax=Methanorbis furvi TaxID=3028299 RepID=A0AAE4MBU1_9EURY|nr:hypothetical protein [Methanocorpusculaceae archaeon Sp1]MDV0441264.1 hypothetical protein [Methanocorpusculaceae archaeon Ag1]